MNKRHYEHTLPNIRGSLSNTYFIPFHCSKSDAKVSRKRDAKQSLSIGKNKTTKMRYIDMYNTYI